MIEKYSPKFKFENMYVENVLPIYIALSEIFYLDEELPIKVSINEAIELAKIYGDDSTKKIAN
ncbi:MAG: transcription antitermination protein NusB [Candidatus Peribacteria bacterium]|nr:transcription antitermination protein NusB [Candidatus Peribacteria bacterium]